MSFAEAVVRSPVKVSVGVLLIVLFGLVALERMPMQLTPEVQRPTITIDTLWPGGSVQDQRHHRCRAQVLHGSL